MGAIILQGPHHSAQKSSNTGLSDLRTSLSNVASLVWTILGLLTAEIPPLGDSIVSGGGFVWEIAAKTARSDDARPFGHNTAALAVLITLKGYR
jgi:hypothetical protein